MQDRHCGFLVTDLRISEPLLRKRIVMRTNTRKKPLMATGILIAAVALLLAPGPGMATPEVDDDDDGRNEWDE